MSGLSPADLSRCLPPKQLTLHSINVKSTPRKHRIREAYLPSVRMVAEALGERSLRKRYGRAWRRDREIDRLVERLDMGGTSLILLGDSGCGKTTLLANAVRQLERKNGKGDAARVESRHRFWLTNGSRLIAGMQYLGQWEERCDALMKDDVPLAHGTVLGWLESRLFGQRSACEAAASVVTRFKAGLNDPNRPLGVLLFCGPTGVGKTELAKMLAQYLFGAGKAGASKRLIRLDMSEYSGYGAADRLMMRPDGRPSELVEQVRLQPFALVLLDEIEKASPHVFDVLLSVLDEGRLTDRWGRTTIFRSAVIIMTSNLGTSSSETLGFTSQSPAYEREVFSAFRPEFFNRIDSVVTFQPLSRETILAITRKELKDLCSREGLVKANIRLTFSHELINHLAEVGFDARLGARPLQRTIEQRVVAPLARFLVGHQSVGEQVVRLELDDGRVVVR